uniref:hypothetical protein n=1 Tax=Chloroflexus sp. TaxID=1904827 RepID=UPI002ADE3FE4
SYPTITIVLATMLLMDHACLSRCYPCHDVTGGFLLVFHPVMGEAGAAISLTQWLFIPVSHEYIV